MGLFDDILKKPSPVQNEDPLGDTSPTGQGSSDQGGNPGDDTSTSGISSVFHIEKTEPSSIFGNNTPTQVEPITVATPQVINTPEPTANGEDSLIIMSNTPTVEETTPISNNLFSQFNTTETPITIETQTPLAASTPMESNIEENTATFNTPPEITQPAEITELQTPIVESTPVIDSNADSLFGSFSASLAPVEIAPTETLITESSLSSSPLYDLSASMKSEVSVAKSPDELTKDIPNIPVSENSFFHPTDFIEKSVADIDHMIENIDVKHTAKISEAEGYKAEKIRFTHLEKDAYGAASTMDDERKHALEMKELLLGELPENKNKPKDKNSHIETSLTGIAVANSVEKTMEKKKSHHTAKMAA